MAVAKVLLAYFEQHEPALSPEQPQGELVEVSVCPR